MIDWIKYDPYSREIESHVNHLATDGQQVWVAAHTKNPHRSGYNWYDGRYMINSEITHWAKINLPEDTDGTSK
ncbi:hypothetical protein [Paenibacillus ginsengarvi]|uniref:DUF551 domain-containing protein n=1 Tax=Paenibacillus ginsengarvi TaxID=400777 RepID=A0A3B0CT20_9BACL|nr:hypothetical protein [Paenibacillus ginsengarvi]RKN86768.1 hypothetical protein D7M11_02075 [Paenibacillus ginsengarvi]